jgi:catechol-2,3-dioxygenase
MEKKTFDRSQEDMGNIVMLEHCNVRVPDQVTATAFYLQALGFTRDPYVMVGVENMWVNIGQTQFHLPTGAAQVFSGHIGIVVPDLEALAARLTSMKDRLAGTQFACSMEDKYVAVTCPWGNRLRCYAPGPKWGELTLGVVEVDVPVRPGAAAGVARFYEQIMGATATVSGNGNPVARVQVGHNQELIFRETTEAVRPYDGHHVAVYITNFSGPHRRLQERGLVSEESNQYQYRFKDIVDPDTREHLCTIEHEVRCFTHPMYARPLVNRNAGQRQATYVRGRDAFVPGMN